MQARRCIKSLIHYVQLIPGGDLGTGRLLIHLEEGKRKGKEKRRREGEMKREKNRI